MLTLFMIMCSNQLPRGDKRQTAEGPSSRRFSPAATEAPDAEMMDVIDKGRPAPRDTAPSLYSYVARPISSQLGNT